jgi:hypothetical protein
MTCTLFNIAVFISTLFSTTSTLFSSISLRRSHHILSLQNTDTRSLLLLLLLLLLRLPLPLPLPLPLLLLLLLLLRLMMEMMILICPFST